MKQTHTLNRIVVAMMAISHNRVDYPAGAVFEAPEKDSVFLEMAKYVREPTADELKAYEARQTLATVTATEPDDINHVGLQPQPPSDSEPNTSGGLQGHVIIDELNANDPELVAAANPYDGWLKKDLSAELTTRAIEHDATARNDDLEALLIADDAKQADA